VLDTRTGEYWTEDGSHFEPRRAVITTHVPKVINQAEHDERAIQLDDCLSGHQKTPQECLADFRKENKGSETSLSP
jgi:hypothetical protein